MKKIIIISLAIIMSFCMCFTAYAADAFVSSPSTNKAPVIVDVKVDSDACQGEIVVVPYADRDSLSAEDLAALEAAYASIKSSTDLSALCAALTDLASKLGVSVADLAVSDLFNMDYRNCDHATHKDEHGFFHITLEADTLKNFVALLHYDNGAWKVVEGAESDGETLTFKMDDFSPFAIVVNTGEVKPVKNNAVMITSISIMAVSVISVIITFVCTRTPKKGTK